MYMYSMYMYGMYMYMYMYMYVDVRAYMLIQTENIFILLVVVHVVSLLVFHIEPVNST